MTVADVAREAGVSVGTVFNYFPTKEDLFYGRMQDFEAALVDAVRTRAPGESVLAAFRRFVLTGAKALADEERAEAIATAMRIVAGSAALRARERELVARSTHALAELIAEEIGSAAGDVQPLVVAHALIGAQRALVECVHAAVRAGTRGAAAGADCSRERRACVRGARARARRLRRQELAGGGARTTQPARFSRSRRRISHIRSGPTEA